MDTTGLMSVHTLFVREHNRIATFFGENTEWKEERIYQETRRIVGAELQFITYNEFLPLLLSPKTVGQCFNLCFLFLLSFFFLLLTDFISVTSLHFVDQRQQPRSAERKTVFQWLQPWCQCPSVSSLLCGGLPIWPQFGSRGVSTF